MVKLPVPLTEECYGNLRARTNFVINFLLFTWFSGNKSFAKF